MLALSSIAIGGVRKGALESWLERYRRGVIALSSLLSSLQASIHNRLLTCTELVTTPAVPVKFLSLDAMDIDNQIDKALRELGMLVIIRQPSCRNPNAETVISHTGGAGVQTIFDIELEIGIGENVMLNRTNGSRIPCMDVAQFVAQRLSGFKVLGFTALRVVSFAPVDDKELQIYTMTVRTTAAMSPI